MSRRGTYTNLKINPQALFHDLRPAHEALKKALGECSPMGAQYLQVESMIKSLEAGALYFTGNRIWFQDPANLGERAYAAKLLGHGQ